MKKYISISVGIVLAVVVLYNSFYFQKLDVRRDSEEIKKFNPKEKVEYFWENKRQQVLESAIDLKTFDNQLAADPEELIRQHGKKVGITSTVSFLVRGNAYYTPTESGKLAVKIADSDKDYYLRTKFIFGNSARDASGFFKINDFENTMDFNAVATELNKLILTREITKLDSIAEGEKISFYGALEINIENIPKELDIIPLKIEAL
jgi:predicted lipoprotein